MVRGDRDDDDGEFESMSLLTGIVGERGSGEH
jgi:hypothetical protein